MGAYRHKAHVYLCYVISNFGTDNEKEAAILNAHSAKVFKGEDGQWCISRVVYKNEGVNIDKLEWVEKYNNIYNSKNKTVKFD